MLTKRQKIYLPFKRIFDLFFSFILIILLSWLLIIISLLIIFTSKGGILFKQNRIGINKTIFKVLKFRTMRIDTPHNTPTHMLEDPNKYITKVGKFLRKTSLDELPQLFNIFIGNMSFVGPRPALWNQDDLVEERDKYFANSIKPGLTGLAQIKGRDTLPIPIKAKYDGEYTSKFNIWFDIKILFLTIFSVFKEDGVKEGK